MNKALVIASLCLSLVSTSVKADPIEDFFSSLGQVTPVNSSYRYKHRRHIYANHESDGAQVVRASFYGHGERLARHTASGAVFNPYGYTAAHRSLPFGTRLLVSHGGRSVVVTVNDRGPAAYTGRSLDLSYGAARALGFSGTGSVHIARLN